MKVDTMQDMKYVQEWIGRVYAELAELKRYVLTHTPADVEKSASSWRDLVDASDKISAKWSGPGAVEEIRAQREK